MGLLLGGVLLDGFEVSGAIRFGGAQAMAVHKLPGGARVIDTMGPDDSVITWGGILSGGDARDRARALDSIRVAGIAVPLAWDIFTATVILSELKLEYCNSWWVPYQIGCTVLVGTQIPGLPTLVGDVLSSVIGDLGLAGSAPGVSAALSFVGAPGATSVGSQAFTAAVTALAAAKASMSVALGSAELGMTSTDLPSLVGYAGALSSLTSATGYVGRATMNFIDGAI